MVTVLHRQRYGYDVRIYTNDHPPAHVHVWKGNKSVRVKLNSLEFTKNRGYNTRELRQIRRLISENRNLLFEVWNRFHEPNERSS